VHGSTSNEGHTRTTRGQPTSFSNRIQHLLANMGLCLSTTSRIRSTERIGQGTICGMFQRQRYVSTCYVYRPCDVVSIRILDNDSLINIFYLYRPFFLGEGGKVRERLYGGGEPWVQGRWWYRLAHVCQRWRNLTLGSASYLGLSLVSTHSTPVENLLALSPPLACSQP
jgi:hypothetical protein